MKDKNKILVFKNRKAFFDFEILDKIEAGIILFGTEVKSIRMGNISMNGSYCYIDNNKIFIKGMDIAEYKEGTYNNHEPKRDRQLLLHKKEIERIKIKIEEKGLTIIPLSLYPNEFGIFKLEIGVGKGRKKYDRREYIKERESKREIKENFG